MPTPSPKEFFRSAAASGTLNLLSSVPIPSVVVYCERFGEIAHTRGAADAMGSIAFPEISPWAEESGCPQGGPH
jgi:hypothetical protein